MTLFEKVFITAIFLILSISIGCIFLAQYLLSPTPKPPAQLYVQLSEGSWEIKSDDK